VQSVYKIKGLHEQILAGNREFVEDWIASLELFRSHLRAVGLDADNEDLTYLSRPLGDAVKVYEALQARVSAAADMPQIEIFGESPSGMSTDDLGSTRRYYDKIEAEEQQGQQGRCLDYLLPILSAQSDIPALDGSVISYEWPSLYSPTAFEKDEGAKRIADTAAVLINAGVLSPDEYRERAGELLGVDLSIPPQQQPAISEDTAELEEDKGDAKSILSFAFQAQAAALARGHGAPYSNVKDVIEESLGELPPKDRRWLSAFYESQWDEISADVNAFIATRKGEPDMQEVRKLAKTRARLRAEQLDRMSAQAQVRADISKGGWQTFTWRTRGDALVRPEHKELEGAVLPIADGHPVEGFPGDTHGCRCIAEAPTDVYDQEGPPEPDPLVYEVTAADREVYEAFESLFAKNTTDIYGLSSMGEATIKGSVKDLTPKELEVAKSIALFTGGNVESCRNPDAFDLAAAEPFEAQFFEGDDEPYAFTPTKADYQRANATLLSLVRRPGYEGDPSEVPDERKGLTYRGMRVDQSVLDALEVGAPGFPLGNISSSSQGRHTAEVFGRNATAADFVGSETPRPRMEVRTQTTHGTDIKLLSIFPGELETLIGGQGTITAIGPHYNDAASGEHITVVYVQQTTTEGGGL
jgi:hypothetical protein